MTGMNPFNRKLESGLRVMLILALMAAGPAASSQTPNYKVIHDFNGTGGTFPVGNLVADSSGNFYGVLSQDTNATGNCVNTTGCGNVFKLYKTTTGGWTGVPLHKFTGGTTDGASPQGGLVFDGAGNLYGTTYQGGLYGGGIAFKMSPNSSGGWTYAVIYHFGATFADGFGPQAALVLDATGNLYGSTVSGGNSGGACVGSCGVVFELSPSSSGVWTETVLHRFNGNDGSMARAPLIFDSAGNLYGTTQYGGNVNITACFGNGCGVVFELSPNSAGGWNQTVIHSFTSRNDGSFPFYAGVIFDAAGNLYGTTAGGGDNTGCNGGCGVVYQLSANGSGGWNETTIHHFTGTNGVPGYGGAWPESGLTFDAAGNLYGATYVGGTGDGVVYKLSHNSTGWNGMVLHAFSGGMAGGFPFQTGLTLSADGKLYGMTIGGGDLTDCSGGCGVVFAVTP